MRSGLGNDDKPAQSSHVLATPLPVLLDADAMTLRVDGARRDCGGAPL